MKPKFYSILLISILMFVSCEKENPCDEGYTEVNGGCLPDYVVGIDKNSENGKEYYHTEFGSITKEQKVIIDIKHDKTSNWVDDGSKAHFITINGKKGLISREGNILLEPIYDDFTLLGKYIKIFNNGKYGLLNASKEVIVPIEYDKIYLDWSELEYERKEVNEFYAQKKGKYYLINSKGKVIRENISYKEIKEKINIE